VQLWCRLTEAVKILQVKISDLGRGVLCILLLLYKQKIPIPGILRILPPHLLPFCPSALLPFCPSESPESVAPMLPASSSPEVSFPPSCLCSLLLLLLEMLAPSTPQSSPSRSRTGLLCHQPHPLLQKPSHPKSPVGQTPAAVFTVASPSCSSSYRCRTIGGACCTVCTSCLLSHVANSLS
jgi:hypothetical protein